MGEFEEKLNSILSSPKDMEKILGIAKELSGSLSSSEPEPEEKNSGLGMLSGLSDIDPKMMSMFGRIMGEYSNHKDTGKHALINSIKPYLREERKSELERASKIARIAHIAKMVFSEFSGGEFNS